MARQSPKLNVLPPLEALIQARALIADPCSWTKSATGRFPRIERRTAKGETWTYEPTWSIDPKAVKWSAAGALNRIYGSRTGAPGFAELDAAAMGIAGVGIGRYNDDPTTTHAMILAVYDRAITGAKTALTT